MWWRKRKLLSKETSNNTRALVGVACPVAIDSRERNQVQEHNTTQQWEREDVQSPSRIWYPCLKRSVKKKFRISQSFIGHTMKSHIEEGEWGY